MQKGDGKMEHFCKVDDIKVKTILSPEDAYNIAREYHAKNHLIGTVPDNINRAMYLDERNHVTKDIAWMVRAILKDNPFEGMDEITIVVSDSNKEVYCVLDHNGIPMEH